MTLPEEKSALWAAWLRAQLDERAWSQQDLVRASAGTIRPDRVSKWLSAKETPSHRFAIYTANALGATQSDALVAAGFNPAGASDVAADPMEIENRVVRTKLEGISSSQLLVELLRRDRLAQGVDRPVEVLRGTRVRPINGDTRGVDALGVLTPEEVERRRLDLAALTDHGAKESPSDDDHHA